MTRIHVVEPYHSVAMSHMSQPFAALAKLYEVTTGEEVDDAADVNIHMPWHSCANVEKGGNSKHIAVYTHVNAGAKVQLMQACDRADLVTAMSYKGRHELIELGVDPARIHVVYCAANQHLYRRRIIAIVGYPQPTLRKRESLLFDLAWQFDVSQYEFLFVGAGWEDTASALMSLGVAVQAFHADTQEAITAIYQRVDALLVTGYAEGGPLPLLEAMAAGCKVFAPLVGYAADLLDEADLYSDPADLKEKLDAYFKPSLYGHYLTRAWTWDDYAAEYALIIGRMLGTDTELSTESGMNRYSQLLDVIDEIRPRRIVEIGVWKGDTALRMIQQAAKWRPMKDIVYQGFDLFEEQTLGDVRREFSKGYWFQEVIQRRLNATGAGVMLVKGYTRDTLPQYLDPSADLYFVDGGHSEETIETDGTFVLENMSDGAVAIFDDYYLSNAPAGMGCNKFIASLPREKYAVTLLPKTTQTQDGPEIGMVKVSKHATVSVPLPATTYAYAVP